MLKNVVVYLIVLVALLTIIAGAYVILPCFLLPFQTHGAWRYRQIKERWQPELTAHFPPRIPKNAALVRLSFYPGFMQGGSHFQVRVELPSEDIRSLYARFSQQTTESLFGGGGRRTRQSDGRPTTVFYTGDANYGGFPDDYEMMTLDPVRTNLPPGFYWNHGQSHGVAISTNRNEIVYWAEAW